jgi:hypothetical protein
MDLTPQPPSPAARALVDVPGAVLSHESAARVLRIELVEDSGVQRLTVPRNRSRVALEGWDVRRAPLSDADLARTTSGLVLTGPTRTVVDLARVLPRARAVAAADSALRKGIVTVAALSTTLRAGRGPGASQLCAVAALLDPLSGSVLESLLRVLLVEAGMAPPLRQHEVRAGGFLVGRVDFCWPAHRLVVEADGFEHHSDREDYRRDRQRLNQLVSLGWRVLRFSWEDVVHRPAYVVALVRTCLSAGA